MRNSSLFGFSFAAANLVGMAAATGYNNPTQGGGANLGYFPPDFSSNGEPLNVIISGSSSSDVLKEKGLMDYVNAFGYGKECLGLHGGEAMAANLGDGQGYLNQTAEYRWLYGGSPGVGACIETFKGGNHLRSWQQSSTSAWFLAVSSEENLKHKHTVEADGYNKGRDKFVSDAQTNPSYKGKQYSTTVDYVSGWLPTGSNGINHGIAIDGRTAVLTVTVSSS